MTCYCHGARAPVLQARGLDGAAWPRWNLPSTPLWYFPVPQVEQVEHAVLEVPEHPPLLYLPVPHVAQVEHP